MPEAHSNSKVSKSSKKDSEGSSGEEPAQQSLEPSSRAIELRRSIPPVIVRQIEQIARMPGIPARDYFELFTCLVEATGAKNVLEYLWVIDITAATMEIQFYRKMRPLVLERHREARSENLADRELDAASYLSSSKPHSEAKRKAVQRSLVSPTDEAQAFVDSIENYVQIDWLIDSAERRKSKALQDIERHQKSFADRLRVVSDAIIEGTVTPKLSNADDVTEES